MNFFKKKKLFTIFLIILSFYIYLNYTKIVDVNPLIDKTSKHYINELYMSTGEIFENHLSNEEKEMYTFFLENIKDYNKEITINMHQFDCEDYQECFSLFGIANDAILIDHPELLNYASYSGTYENNKLTLRLKYAFPFSFLGNIGTKRIQIIIDDIKKKTKNMSDEEKIRYVYEWMGDNNTYDQVFTYTSKNQSIFNVFVRNNAVCAGFAKASQVIFQNIGINSYTITGTSTGPHMWNIVEYNGKYYYFDSTVATSIKDKNNDYYYKGLEQQFMNSYKADHPDWYPKIETTNMFEN